MFHDTEKPCPKCLSYMCNESCPETEPKTLDELLRLVLELWANYQSAGSDVDDRGYTHASAGYEVAQGDVKEFLEMDRDQLQFVLDNFFIG